MTHRPECADQPPADLIAASYKRNVAKLPAKHRQLLQG